MKKFKKLGFAMACAAMLAATSCSDGSDDGNIVLPPQQNTPPVSPAEPEKTSCEYLFICYYDGDNDLFPDITNDMNNLAIGLNSTKTDSQIKILCLFDGPNFSSEGSRKNKENIKNQKYLDTVGETRLIEIKPISKDASATWTSEQSNYTFDVITGKTFTESCGFIPKNSEGKYEADMSDYNTLKNLLDFAEKTYSPKYTFLSISDHGAGAASATGATRSVCTDETTDKGMMIGNDQIRIAIENSKLKKVDILHLDCCLEANIENAYELKDCVTYFVGSPNVSYGVPWASILTDYMKQDTTPLKLAEQIIIEVSYEKANAEPVTTDNVGSKMPYLNTNSNYSPTYTALDLSNSRAANIEKSFKKVIDIIYDSMDETGFLADKETAWNNSLLIYCQNNPDYVPKPADYLVSSDYSFLISRNVHGWVGDAPENYGSSTNIPIFTPNIRGMTCMAYNGSYNQLVDIGYLMDMFVCNTYYSTTYADAELCTGVKGSDFVDACKQVCEDIYQSLVISHRVDCSIKKAEAANIINIYDDIDDTNFYLQKIMENPMIKSVFGGKNHYGLVVSSCDTPDVIGSPATLYKNIGGSPSENGSLVYKDCCKFVKETKWLPLLKKILPENNVVWNQYDEISSPAN